MKNAALLVDMQNAFCSPDGSFAARGWTIPRLAQVIKTALALREYARSESWPLFYTRLAYRPDYSDGGLLLDDHPRLRSMRAYLDSTEDAEIIPELSPQSKDVVITKTRYDPFVGTRLEQELIARGVGRIVVAGLLTNVCVEATVRGAYDRGVRAIVLRDGVASYSDELHEASLQTLARHYARVCDFAALSSILPSV